MFIGYDIIREEKGGRSLLKFNSDGSFGMLLFGDIHEKYDYETAPAFKDFQKLMTASIEEYKPDICVFLGDNLSSALCRDDYDAFCKALEGVFKPAFDRGIPVYAIMGNHEHDAGVDEDLIRAYSSVPLLNMRSESFPGKADYHEVVYSSDGKEPKAILWFLDSNNLCSDQGVDCDSTSYDYVHTDQIEWFEKTYAEENEKAGSVLPSYVFQHIPVPEEYELLRKAKFYELPVSVKGHNTLSGNRYVGKSGTKGYVGEGPCAPDFNNGQFESWKKTGGVKAAFFGHDHLNDFSGFVDGIYLAQHKTAGFRVYTDGCKSCVRYVRLNEDDPSVFTDELKHFKEFGLKCESLGPIFKRISDRQSMMMHFAARALGVSAAAAALAYTSYRLISGGKINGKK